MVGGFDGFVAGLDEFKNLLLGVATGFGKKDFGAFDGRGLDFLVAMAMVGIGNSKFKVVKDGLSSWEEFLCARNFGSIDLFHKLIIS